jgi:hypothetical protein
MSKDLESSVSLPPLFFLALRKLCSSFMLFFSLWYYLKKFVLGIEEEVGFQR